MRKRILLLLICLFSTGFSLENDIENYQEIKYLESSSCSCSNYFYMNMSEILTKINIEYIYLEAHYNKYSTFNSVKYCFGNIGTLCETEYTKNTGYEKVALYTKIGKSHILKKILHMLKLNYHKTNIII